MNIAYTSSDGYARFVGTSLMSLLDWNKNVSEIHIYVIDMKISDENKKYLLSITEQYSRRLTFIDGEKIITELVKTHSLDDFHGGINSYCKILPDLFLPTMDKVLFLDADTIINQSILPLYDIDLDNHILAAVPDVGVYFFGHEDYEIVNKNTVYFNTGVILYNMDMVKKENLSERIFDAKRKYGKPLKLADQSLLNYALKDDEGLRVHFKYNTYVHSVPANFFSEYTCDKNDKWFLDTVNEIIEARKSPNPAIIHYVRGARLGGRPWLKWNTSYYSRQYLKYWRKSPWKNIKRGSNIHEVKRLKRVINKNNNYDTPLVGTVAAVIEIIVSKYSSRKTWEKYKNGKFMSKMRNTIKKLWMKG